MKENKNLFNSFKMPAEILAEKGEKIKACNEDEIVRSRELENREAEIIDKYDRKPCIRQALQGYDPWGRELFPGTCTSGKSINLLTRFLNIVLIFRYTLIKLLSNKKLSILLSFNLYQL